jgi:hypothetical protein
MNELNQPCEDHCESLALMTSGDLSDTACADLFRHLAECGGCRAYWQALQNDHLALVNFSRTLQGRVQAIEDSIVDKVLSGHEMQEPTRGRDTWWRWIMQTRSGRLLAGGSVAAAVLFLVLFIQDTSGPYLAWAEVFENARNATSCRFRAQDRDRRDNEAVKIYSDLGFAQETYEDGQLVESYAVDFMGRTVVHTVWPVRLAVKMELGEAMLQRYLEKNPSEMFDGLAELETEDLGRRRISGREVVGVGASGRDIVPDLMDHAEFELWADPQTRLPVRLDVTGRSDDGTMTKRVRFDNFEWNVPLTAQDFQPEIPSRFEVVSGIELEMDEPHAIDALRRIAVEIDRFPSTLAYEQLRRELWQRLGRRMLTPAVLPEIHRIRGACEFYGQLVRNGKQAIYFGDRVQPGEAERVLLRWQEEDGLYRVVFGDLRVETVTAEELVKLESH